MDPPSTSLPDPTTPIDLDCDPELDPVDATGLAVAEVPENPLARTLTVALEAPAGAVVSCALVAGPTRLVEVLPTDATWRYLDDGSAAPAGYEEPGFDDASWKTAPAPFHREQVGTTLLGEAAAPPSRTSARRSRWTTCPSSPRSARRSATTTASSCG